MIRYDVAIRLVELNAASAREAVQRHHRLLPYSGDGFVPSAQLGARHWAIEVDGQRVGTAAVGDRRITLCTVAISARKYDRQILEVVLSETGATSAYVTSWDRHQVELFGNFAATIDNQAYQFELLSPADLRRPLPGLTLDTATEADLGYLESTGFQPDFAERVSAGQVRVARIDGRGVGIALVVPHPLAEDRADIGMFTNPELRRTGIGRSILAVAADQVLRSGGTPVAGCWWRNAESRRVLESAGLTCVGTVFDLELDPDRFRNADRKPS